MLPLMAYAEEWCFDTWFPAIIQYLRPGVYRNLAPGWATDPDVRDYFADSQIGTRVADAPILYLQGTVELLHMVSRKQVHRMCAVGDVVTYTEYLG